MQAAHHDVHTSGYVKMKTKFNTCAQCNKPIKHSLKYAQKINGGLVCIDCKAANNFPNPPALAPTELKALQEAGCACILPLLGHRPPLMAPRCRLCNSECPQWRWAQLLDEFAHSL